VSESVEIRYIFLKIEICIYCDAYRLLKSAVSMSSIVAIYNNITQIIYTDMIYCGISNGYP